MIVTPACAMTGKKLTSLTTEKMAKNLVALRALRGQTRRTLEGTILVLHVYYSWFEELRLVSALDPIMRGQLPPLLLVSRSML